MASMFLGTLGLTLFALIAITLAVTRGSISIAYASRIRRVSAVVIFFQLGHFVEETRQGFYIRFPELFGLVPWPREYFLVFNIFWLVAWSLAMLGIVAFGRISAFALWFLAIASMANGIIHPLLAFAVGSYFPGLWTSPIVGILGVMLFRTLRVGTYTEQELARQ